MKTTTKIIGILLIGILFSFVSCSKEDEDATGGGALVGKWAFVSETWDGKTELYEHSCDSKKDHWEFTDNRVREIWYDEDCVEEVEGSSTYSVEGNKLIIARSFIDSFTFSISGNTMTVEYTDEGIKGGYVLQKM